MKLVYSFNYKNEIYQRHLKTLSGFNFTHREIDVISVIIHNRGEKKIANILDISPRTVSSHIYNMMRKIGCSSREQIIDVIENSGKIQYVREYYAYNIIDTQFKKTLKKIADILSGKECNLHLITPDILSQNLELLENAKEHLKMVNIKFGVKNEDFHCVINQEKSDNISDNEEYIKLSIKDIKTRDKNPELELVFSKNDDYFQNIFLIIEKIYPDNDFSKYFQEFDVEVDKLSKLWPETTNSDNISDTNYINNSDKIRNKIAVVLLTIFLVSSFILLMYDSFKLSKLYSSNKIISDLPIPHEKVILNREQIMESIDTKLSKTKGINVVALTGLGGSGKTTLARQYAKRKFFPVAWEINGENTETIILSFQRLAYSLSKDTKDSSELNLINNIPDQDEKIRKLFTFSADLLKKYNGWLIIYNDVNSFKDIRKYFPYDSDVWGNGNVIITTRDGNISHNLYILKENVIDIPELNFQEKMKLFSSITRSSKFATDSYEYENFINNIPPYPLDVSLAAYYIKEEEIDFSDYLTIISKPRADFLSVQETILNDIGEYTKTRYDIVELSIRQIIAENPEFTDLFIMLSLISSEDIPKGLLSLYKNDSLISKFMHSLRKFSLINKSGDAYFSIHNTTQNIMSEYLFASIDKEVISAKLSDVSKILEDYILDESVKHNYKSYLIVKHLDSFLSKKSTLFEAETLASLSAKIGVYFFHINNHDKSKEYLEYSLKMYKKLYGENHVKTAWIMSRLGILYRNSGDNKKAKESLEKALLIDEKEYGREHIETIKVYTYLGSVYRSIGNYPQARKLLEKAFKIYKEFYGLNNNNTAWVAAYLGWVYKCECDFAKAKEYLELAYDVYSNFHGSESTSTAWVGARLGNLYIILGDFAKAKELLNKAMEIHKTYDGSSSFEAAWCMLQISKILAIEKKYTSALNMMSESLIIFEKKLSKDHDIIAWTKLHIATIYIEINRIDDAKKLLLPAFKVYSDFYGKNHCKTADIINKIAICELAKENYNEAENLAKEAKKILNELSHLHAYESYEILADIYLAKNKFEKDVLIRKKNLIKADKYSKKAISIVSKLLPSNSKTLRDLLNKFSGIKDSAFDLTDIY
jgi:tetratricopeptide (TPR) repeat protein